MPRPRSLTPRRLAQAALDVLDRDGATGLSMRAVAAELHLSTMGLYRYVTDRDELERLIVDLVLEDLDDRTSEEEPWQERITQLAHRAREAVLLHPAAIPLLLTHRQDSTHAQRWGEAILAVLGDAGFDGTTRAIAFRTLLSYILGALQVQHHGPLDGPGTKALADLPADRYPHLAHTARAAAHIDPAEEFRVGLATVLRGLRP
ncbi:TetR/AcrR family transcriptional regulator [Actinospica robiniae]|uniref:TetR/AcrR family transcriptional regulator n=1 Tax=Actinospica robiniae TaxID=304901 RepID=UPI000428EBD3|nr:TetR/AcrR family transcriptional regulator C-terminal domain-containing protein [Actinospica robiniae]